MGLPSFFTAPLWKLTTIGAGIVSLVLIALLLSTTFENRDLSKQRTELATRINDPKTGYVVQLAQAATNVETLKMALNTQRISFQKESAAQNEKLKASEIELSQAQAVTRSMQLKLNHFLATTPQGDTLEERIRDIDQRAKLELVQ